MVIKITQEEYEEHTAMITICPYCFSSAVLSTEEPVEPTYLEKAVEADIIDFIKMIDKTKAKIKEDNNESNKSRKTKSQTNNK